MQDHSGSTSEIPVPTEDEPPAWLEEARRTLTGHCAHLVYQDDDGAIVSFAIQRGWTRIGRSTNADLRLDDPSVSRRHALIVAEPGKDLRVLDDRSLNGVFVNGEPVDWGTLQDGDELTVGRFKLYALSA